MAGHELPPKGDGAVIGLLPHEGNRNIPRRPMSDSVIDAITNAVLVALMSWPAMCMSGVLTICAAINILIQLPG
jgi:hypothetical protein